MLNNTSNFTRKKCLHTLSKRLDLTKTVLFDVEGPVGQE